MGLKLPIMLTMDLEKLSCNGRSHSISNNRIQILLATLNFALICVIIPTTSNLSMVNCLTTQQAALIDDFYSVGHPNLDDNDDEDGYQFGAGGGDFEKSWTSSRNNNNELEQLRQIILGSSTSIEKKLSPLAKDNGDNDDVGMLHEYTMSGGQLNDDNNYIETAPVPPRSSNEIYILEDKDYPKSIYEDYSKRIGQVSGITALPNDDVAIFHRAERQWTGDTFNETSKQLAGKTLESANEHLIKNDTIMLLDGENGNSIASFGSNLFYMPHSIASDSLGNLWISDVGRHQVMRLPVANFMKFRKLNQNIEKTLPLSNWLPANMTTIWPDIVLGESFIPGSDEHHFCQPSELAISSNGRLLFVADGYCNGRVMVFLASSGQFLTSFGAKGIQSQSGDDDDDDDGAPNSDLNEMNVVHSLTLIEEKNLLCVADRENGRILCYLAGLDENLANIGKLVIRLKYPIGRVFAIQAISQNHLLVSSNQLNTKRYDMAILNPFTEELKLVWTSSDLLEPHSLTRTFDKQYAYAADLSKDAYKKVFKFNIIQRINSS